MSKPYPTSTSYLKCGACGVAGHASVYQVAEMMLGQQKMYEYAECSHCGTLQLINPPEEYAVFYQQSYYSTSRNAAAFFKPYWKAYLKSFRDYYCFTGKGFVGKWLQRWMPNKAIEHFSFRHAALNRHMKILDVGCGTGLLAYAMYNAGFYRIKGIDPFIAKPISYPNGLQIAKGELNDLEEDDFDVIMLNHAFEHIPNPREVLQTVHAKLSSKGICILRVPTVSSFAWRKYREHWVQLDAPRHHFLYSKAGLEALAHQHDFVVETIVSESTTFQFLGSEQYLKGIPMYGDKRSWFEGNAQLFSPAELADFEQKAKQLNAENDGDSIFVLLKKK